MERSAALKLIGVIVFAYGVYVALQLPPLFVGPTEPLLTTCLLVQAVASIVAGVGLWRHTGWAPAATIVVGAAIAATELIESALLGIIALDRAVVVGAIAVLVAIAIAMFASGTRRLVVHSRV